MTPSTRRTVQGTTPDAMTVGAVVGPFETTGASPTTPSFGHENPGTLEHGGKRPPQVPQGGLGSVGCLPFTSLDSSCFVLKWEPTCQGMSGCPVPGSGLSYPPPPLCRSPPLVLPQGGVGDRHLVNPKRAKLPPKGAVQSIPVESGEHVQEFKVKWSRTKKFYT